MLQTVIKKKKNHFHRDKNNQSLIRLQFILQMPPARITLWVFCTAVQRWEAVTPS